ncbi:MAG: M48 family metalloprotease [Rhodobacteraceae bacterium]|nr:M48 family metalloprotease [Paracoccaceae bacterium]
MKNAVIHSIFGLALALCAGQASADWPTESVMIGERDHPKIVARFGGMIDDGPLADYVRRVGQLMVAVSSRPDENWQFIVLDSPEVNAFALPGGYVYITRGLLALANSEAELAAVLAHEITHIIEEHVENRAAANQDAVLDGALGALVDGLFSSDSFGDIMRNNIESALGEIGANSQEQEFAADRGGIILLERAGYNPHAQAEFLGSMAANSALRAIMAGRGFDPEKVPFFANHPAPAERQIIARQLAGQGTGTDNIDAYLAMIEGLLYGDSAQQGFVRGQTYFYPVLGFTFTAPHGLQIQNRARQINIIGPHGSTLVMTGARDTGGSLRDYVSEWVGSIPRRERIGRRISHVQRLDINGLEAVTGTIGLRRNARRGDLQMTVIRFNGKLIRFAGFSRSRDTAAQNLLMQTVESFVALGPDAASQLQTYHIEIYEIQRRDTVDSLGAAFPQQGFGPEMLRVLNGLEDGEVLETGMPIKILVR